MQQEGALLDAITVGAADHISTSPFAGAIGTPPLSAGPKKTLLVLNASSWIGQAHLGAASAGQQAMVAEAVGHLAINSPTENKFSPWTTATGEEGSVKEGGFYVGSGSQTPAVEPQHTPSLFHTGPPPSVSFLSGIPGRVHQTRVGGLEPGTGHGHECGRETEGHCGGQVGAKDTRDAAGWDR